MTAGPDLLLERVRAATADEYQIDREIGRGGMAAVFLARDIALERRVAIKVMLPDLTSVQGVQDRFVIEARTAAHLDHPGIVTVYGVKQRGGLLFIVMKFIEGHTLEGVLRSQGRLDPIAVALIGGRVAEALAFAHGEGVVHRDVKPSNIMIDPRGRPVVTDFGIARVMTAQSITVAGSMLGTPTHMSPEQCRGLPATAASDQYALGVTMYEMLTGRAPFTGSLFELITAHREQAPPPLSEFVGGVDPALAHTVMRMLAKDPQERWGSLADVIQRLAVHTTIQKGDENLRATLMLSGTASRSATPERGLAPVDLLTPPESLGTRDSTLGNRDTALGNRRDPTEGGQMGIGNREGAVASVITRPDSNPHIVGDTVGNAPGGRAKKSGVVTGLIAGVVVAAAAGIVMWSGREAPTTAPGAARPDSAPSTVQPPVVTQPAQSAATSDSAARATVVRDSIVRDSIVRDSLVRDSSAKALAAKDSATRADSIAKAAATAAAVPARRDPPESVTVQCARLLERQSLGERLTDAERGILQRRCPK